MWRDDRHIFAKAFVDNPLFLLFYPAGGNEIESRLWAYKTFDQSIRKWRISDSVLGRICLLMVF